MSSLMKKLLPTRESRWRANFTLDTRACLNANTWRVIVAVARHSPAEAPDWACSSWIHVTVKLSDEALGVVNSYPPRKLSVSGSSLSVTPAGAVTAMDPSLALLWR